MKKQQPLKCCCCSLRYTYRYSEGNWTWCFGIVSNRKRIISRAFFVFRKKLQSSFVRSRLSLTNYWIFTQGKEKRKKGEKKKKSTLELLEKCKIRVTREKKSELHTTLLFAIRLSINAKSSKSCHRENRIRGKKVTLSLSTSQVCVTDLCFVLASSSSSSSFECWSS